jgi:hypothetical protein
MANGASAMMTFYRGTALVGQLYSDYFNPTSGTNLTTYSIKDPKPATSFLCTQQPASSPYQLPTYTCQEYVEPEPVVIIQTKTLIEKHLVKDAMRDDFWAMWVVITGILAAYFLCSIYYSMKDSWKAAREKKKADREAKTADGQPPPDAPDAPPPVNTDAKAAKGNPLTDKPGSSLPTSKNAKAAKAEAAPAKTDSPLQDKTDDQPKPDSSASPLPTNYKAKDTQAKSTKAEESKLPPTPEKTAEEDNPEYDSLFNGTYIAENYPVDESAIVDDPATTDDSASEAATNVDTEDDSNVTASSIDDITPPATPVSPSKQSFTIHSADLKFEVLEKQKREGTVEERVSRKVFNTPTQILEGTPPVPRRQPGERVAGSRRQTREARKSKQKK